MIVVLEGLDNCGKNTIAKMLSEKYEDITSVEFPDYSTAFGQFIRKELMAGNLSPISMQLLFSSERLSKADLVHTLSSKGIMVAVRYSYSAIAYGVARGISKELLYLLEKDMPTPDKKIYLRISAEDSVRRAQNPDSFETNFNLLSAAARIYEEIIETDKDWYVIDATKGLKEVFLEVENIIFL